MSIAIMTDVWKLDMDGHRKLILLSLADNANDTGRCWPSQPTIARRSSISERQLRDHLHGLAADGWIIVLSLGNGRGHSTEYLLNLEQIKAAKAEDEKAAKAEDSDIKAEVGAEKAEAASRPTVIEPSIEPPEEEPLILCCRAFDGLMGTLACTPPIQQAIEDWLESAPDVAPGATVLFEDACIEAALNDGKSLKYVLAILERWQREGRADRRQKRQVGTNSEPQHYPIIIGGVAVKTMMQEAEERRARNG